MQELIISTDVWVGTFIQGMAGVLVVSVLQGSRVLFKSQKVYFVGMGNEICGSRNEPPPQLYLPLFLKHQYLAPFWWVLTATMPGNSWKVIRSDRPC